MLPTPDTTDIDLDTPPALVARAGRAAWRPPGGPATIMDAAKAAGMLARTAPLIVHLRATARRLGVDAFPAFDLLELFAFVRPARFCLPTPAGLALAVGLPAPHGLEEEAASLPRVAALLLDELTEAAARGDATLAALARLMARSGWRWGRAVLAALAADPDPRPEDAR
ncbi:MAG: ATP-dependent DNA helicase, partial [Alphaproteobacteria bacterium]|nr:ATP-dependent DNA helicase [Alphaproteobacteria bacterium]